MKQTQNNTKIERQTGTGLMSTEQMIMTEALKVNTTITELNLGGGKENEKQRERKKKQWSIDRQ